MKISCIIVDDEPASREILEKYVHDCPNLNLVQKCKNAFEANDVISSENIQLIFLDINMPLLSGMMFYKSLTNPPYVIFTTAYPEFAVEGFEVNAVDYLLKPFPFERFIKSVNKAIELINSKKQEFGNAEFILLKSDKKIHRININDIFYLEAIGDYVKVFFGDKHIIVHDTFQKLLKLLPSGQFIRIHKSYAISIHKFDSIEGNRVKINNRFIPIGQTYRSDFMEFIRDRGNC
jgi:DNA-binding LytR/AlgR family response regulator